ncbi:MAG: MerR family transcriptional regulator [Desulfovibrionaceae bacterium]
MNWLSVAEISKITGIPAPTARRYASLFREFLPSKKMGRITKYSDEAVGIFEQIARNYNEGHVTTEIEEMLRREYARTIDLAPGEGGYGGPAAQPPALPGAGVQELSESLSGLMGKFGECLEIIADQKALIEAQREDIQKLKTAFVLLARSQKKLREAGLPGGGDTPALPSDLLDRTHALESKGRELEEATLKLSFDSSDMKVKLQILESELVRLRKDRRELEKYLQDKIERIKP